MLLFLLLYWIGGTIIQGWHSIYVIRISRRTAAVSYNKLTKELEQVTWDLAVQWPSFTPAQRMDARRSYLKKLEEQCLPYEECKTVDDVCCHYFIESIVSLFNDPFIQYQQDIGYIFEQFIYYSNCFYPPYVAMHLTKFEKNTLQKASAY